MIQELGHLTKIGIEEGRNIIVTYDVIDALDSQAAEEVIAAVFYL